LYITNGTQIVKDGEIASTPKVVMPGACRAQF